MRRLCGFWIGSEQIGTLAKGGTKTVFIRSSIPETARFLYASYDQGKRMFMCVFEDESFEPIPDGMDVPVYSGVDAILEVFSG